MTNEADDRFEIMAVLDRYCEALDRRNWELMEQVFTPDVEFDFGDWKTSTRDEAVAAIRGFIDGCGRTQHLQGNYRIELDGDRARSRVYIRAFHVGAGKALGKTFEMAGEYRDELLRTPEGWRCQKRVGRSHFEQGPREVLGPGD